MAVLLELSADFDRRAQAASDGEKCEERTVSLRRKGLCREPPATLEGVDGEDLRKYSVDALRKLAKSAGVDAGKNASRDRLIAALQPLCQAVIVLP
jgi:hypothetical protein